MTANPALPGTTPHSARARPQTVQAGSRPSLLPARCCRRNTRPEPVCWPGRCSKSRALRGAVTRRQPGRATAHSPAPPPPVPNRSASTAASIPSLPPDNGHTLRLLSTIYAPCSSCTYFSADARLPGGLRARRGGPASIGHFLPGTPHKACTRRMAGSGPSLSGSGPAPSHAHTTIHSTTEETNPPWPLIQTWHAPRWIPLCARRGLHTHTHARHRKPDGSARGSITDTGPAACHDGSGHAGLYPSSTCYFPRNLPRRPLMAAWS